MRNNHYFKKTLALLALIMVGFTGFATNLVNPATDGGFESGASFGANGWTVVNGTATNKWFVGGVPGAATGANCAYISNDVAGAVFAYTNSSSSTVHFYRDLAVPALEASISVSFDIKNVGESGWDRVFVSAAPTSVTPVFNVPLSTSLVIPGATLHYTDAAANGVYHASGNIFLPGSYAGSTVRLIISWENDGSLGGPTGAAIDNINVNSALPSTITSKTVGGLYTDPNTWVGGVVRDLLIT